MVAAIWILAAIALVVWSLVAWGLYRLLTLDPQWVGDLKPLIERIPFGEQFDEWVPGWQELLRTAIDLMQAILGWIGGAAPWLVGVAWGVGVALLLAGAALLAWLVALWRRRSGSGPHPQPRP
jgi:hypothetical protein